LPTIYFPHLSIYINFIPVIVIVTIVVVVVVIIVMIPFPIPIPSTVKTIVVVNVILFPIPNHSTMIPIKTTKVINLGLRGDNSNLISRSISHYSFFHRVSHNGFSTHRI
jgi:hypothetical protein